MHGKIVWGNVQQMHCWGGVNPIKHKHTHRNTHHMDMVALVYKKGNVPAHNPSPPHTHTNTYILMQKSAFIASICLKMCTDANLC